MYTLFEYKTKYQEEEVNKLKSMLFQAEAYHPEAFNPGSMLPIIPNQSNLTS